LLAPKIPAHWLFSVRGAQWVVGCRQVNLLGQQRNLGCRRVAYDLDRDLEMVKDWGSCSGVKALFLDPLLGAFSSVPSPELLIYKMA
jgi:hypothetical protein